MPRNPPTDPTVLVVDDEPDVADTYATFLAPEYDVKVAYGGEAALDCVREHSIDVVLLDRRMPDLSGDEVLVTIRDRGLDTRVALVTAVDPEFDVLGLGFDDYLLKPVGLQELRDAVARLLDVETYDSVWQELSQLRVCRNVLEAEHSAHELETHAEFRGLVTRIERLESQEAAFREGVGRAASPTVVGR